MLEKSYSTQSPVSGFTLRHMKYGIRHLCDGSSGTDRSLIGFVKSGKADIDISGCPFVVESGEFFYLPKGTRYRSLWCGNPGIEYYIIHIDYQSDVPLFCFGKRQDIDTEKVFSAEKALSENDTCTAFSLLMDIYSAVTTHLTPAPMEENGGVLSDAKRYIECHFREDFDIPCLCRELCVSESTLYHTFKKGLNTTPVVYRNEIRVQYAARLIKDGERNTQKIVSKTGFSSAIYFRECFKKYFGMTPGEYRKATYEKRN